MPELPEVETVVKYLNSQILNFNLKAIKVFDQTFIKNATCEELSKCLIGSIIKSIERKGKYIIFNFSNNYSLLSHLRMEGKFFVNDIPKTNVSKHDYLIFEFTNNQNQIRYLIYNDTRKFGTFHLYKTNELIQSKELSKVSFDPLDKNFSFDNFYSKIHNKKISIKEALLDQNIVSGIGNIYCSEILFDCKINPTKKSNEINIKEANNIISSSQKILSKAIKYNGTTKKSFSFGDNNPGQYQKFLKVYGRENQRCFDCNLKIKKIIQGQRSTFYCEKCQN